MENKHEQPKTFYHLFPKRAFVQWTASCPAVYHRLSFPIVINAADRNFIKMIPGRKAPAPAAIKHFGIGTN
ncbi:MAG: hypothetical protein ABI813_04905 [Bacteroidota bacterium]